MILQSCMPVEEKKEVIQFDFSWDDPVIRSIYDFEIDQKLDSIKEFTKSKYPHYRYAAARSFASIRDVESLDALIPLLKDSVPEVATTAAFAIGQIGEVSAVSALMNAFRSADSVGRYKALNQAILEATGKCGETRALDLLASISSYTPRDTALLMGQAGGIYRLMLRNYTSTQGTAVMARFVSNNNFPKSVRTLAANYFHRIREVDMSDYTYTFKRVLESDKNPHIRMAIATGLARNAARQALPGLVETIAVDADYRVKSNFIRGLGDRFVSELEWEIRANISKYPYPLQRTAAEYVLRNGHEEGSIGYWDMARSSELHYEASNTLASAASRHLPFYYSITRQQVSRFLRNRYSESDNIYEKRSTLMAMSADIDNMNFLIEESSKVESPLLRSGIAEALIATYDEAHMSGKPNAGKRRAKQNIVPALFSLFQKNDAGATAIIAGFLRTNWNDVKNIVTDVEKIRQVLSALELPKEIETYNEIKHLLSIIESVDFVRESAGESKSMDWATFDQWSGNPNARVKTNRGSFTIELLKDDAPLTVLNFVQLVENDFFNDKAVHRVVPNFVIQTGCTRGDGYGSEDYTIRSELFGKSYDKEGYVGMASAGNHTECSQWFVTHCPTFHLDGNYTIFGYVTKGMDVIHNTQVGDKIQSITVN